MDIPHHCESNHGSFACAQSGQCLAIPFSDVTENLTFIARCQELFWKTAGLRGLLLYELLSKTAAYRAAG